MSASKGYNGHKNWNHWNVSLWINNDEGLRALAQRSITARPGDRTAAAQYMLESLRQYQRREHGMSPKTPDGAPYSVSSIRAAMRDM